jgi:hypothetical protein
MGTAPCLIKRRVGSAGDRHDQDSAVDIESDVGLVSSIRWHDAVLNRYGIARLRNPQKREVNISSITADDTAISKMRLMARPVAA